MGECVAPFELAEGSLMAYADGEASDEVRSHLARCPHCAAQVEAYRRTAAMLRAALYRRSCPPPEQLGLYQLNLLPAKEKLIVARHVRECPHCRRELDELAQVGDKPSLLKRLRQVIDVVEAILLPPPRLKAASLRGVSFTSQRFHTDDLDVLISLQPSHSRGRKTIMGRLLPRERVTQTDPTQEVWLIQGDEAWALPVETGRTFTFNDVEAGEYKMGLEWRGQAILIQKVTVA